MRAEDFPQISAKRLFHQINLNSARRTCSLSVLLSVTSDETFLATTLSRFFRSRYSLTRLVEHSRLVLAPGPIMRSKTVLVLIEQAGL